MAITRYHNIAASTDGVDTQLLAPGDGASNIKSIMITNIHASNDATVSLFLQKNTDVFYIIHTIAIPADTSLLLDNKALLSFDNSETGYGLNVTLSGSDTVNILINV